MSILTGGVLGSDLEHAARVDGGPWKKPRFYTRRPAPLIFSFHCQGDPKWVHCTRPWNLNLETSRQNSLLAFCLLPSYSSSRMSYDWIYLLSRQQGLTQCPGLPMLSRDHWQGMHGPRNIRQMVIFSIAWRRSRSRQLIDTAITW